MNTLPELTILICTYERQAELLQSLEEHKKYIQYPFDKLQWVIADDHSKTMTKVTNSKLYKELSARIVKTEVNSGWGANVNNGLRNCTTEYIYFVEEDYLPKTFIPLDRAVQTMLTKPDIGMVRFRGTAGSHLVYHQFESDISKYNPDYQGGIGAVLGKVSYLQIDGGSPDLYIYSNGPHLKHRRFHEFYGMYPEGLRLGTTEEVYAHTVKDKMRESGAPAIILFPEFIPMLFDHIGKSYQLTDKDRANV